MHGAGLQICTAFYILEDVATIYLEGANLDKIHRKNYPLKRSFMPRSYLLYG